MGRVQKIKLKPAIEDLVEVFSEEDYPQGGDDWFAMHVGVPTASVFRSIVAESRDGDPDTGVRAKLLRRFAAEVIFGQPMETFSNDDMNRGKVQEPWLLERYSFRRGVTVERVGFVRRTVKRPPFEDLVIGCSPDGLVGAEGGVEVKSMRPDLIVALLDSGRPFPSEHRWQCVGSMWATGRKWWDVIIGYEGFPASPIYRLERDDGMIATLRDAVETFSYDLRKMVERVRAKGGIR